MAKHISTKLLFVKQFSSVLQSLLDCQCKFVGVVTRDWVIPCLFKYTCDPFKFNLQDHIMVDRFYKVFQNIKVQVLGPIALVGSTLNIRGLEFKHELSTENDSIVCTFNITDYYGSHKIIFGIDVIEKLNAPLMDVDQFIFSDTGITNMDKFNMAGINKALNQECSLVMPIMAGVTFQDFKKRQRSIDAIFEKIKNNWTVTGVPFNIFKGPPVTNKVCLCCQTDVESDHLVLQCRCSHTAHVDCIESWINSEIEQHSYFKCPGCRDQLSFV